MEEIKFDEVTLADQKALQEAADDIVRAIHKVRDAMIEIFGNFMEKVRRFAEMLGRFFLKMQLLEWRFPVWLADLISEKIYRKWACQLGFRWFRNKMMLE